jgi:hypothetical protein
MGSGGGDQWWWALVRVAEDGWRTTLLAVLLLSVLIVGVALTGGQVITELLALFVGRKLQISAGSYK